MAGRQQRSFSDSPAIRKKVPLLIGVTGPSGGGKTYSALRLATGMAKVYGGEVVAIDTEHNRLLHYSDLFKFRHIPFAPPFSPLDFIDAIRHAIKIKNSVLIIDSMSMEHVGEGGVLDQHDRMVLEKGMNFNMLAWAEPKAQRRALINFILQSVDAAVFCFRAKEGLDLDTKPPTKLGYQPQAGDEYIFELAANALLLEGAMGVPTWNPQEKGAKKFTKMPEQFRQLLTKHQGPLDERIGEEMAKWAIGGPIVQGPTSPPPPPSAASAVDPQSAEEVKVRLRNCRTMTALAELWSSLGSEMKEAVRQAKDERKEELELLAKAGA